MQFPAAFLPFWAIFCIEDEHSATGWSTTTHSLMLLCRQKVYFEVLVTSFTLMTVTVNSHLIFATAFAFTFALARKCNCISSSDMPGKTDCCSTASNPQWIIHSVSSELLFLNTDSSWVDNGFLKCSHDEAELWWVVFLCGLAVSN